MGALGSFSPDNSDGGSFPKATKSVNLKADAGALSRLEVLGKITKGAVTQSYSGTGSGTLTLDATEPRLSGSKAGTYKVVMTSATAYKVIDPDGTVIGIEPALGAFANKIKFALAAGDSAFVAGDTFSVTIAAGSGYYAAYDSEAVDGTEKPLAILLEDKATSTAVQAAPVALTGQWVEDEFVFKNDTDTFSAIEDELRALGIFGVPARD
jgi:hypothetical protein